MRYGYVRVSTSDQKLDRQFESMKEAGIDKCNIFKDEASGKNFDRVGYQALKMTMAKGDTLVISSLDRLGRNYDGIAKEWAEFDAKGIGIKVLNMPILDTENASDDLMKKFISDIVVKLLSFVAQQERENIRERQKQGIELRKAQGGYMSKTSLISDEDIEPLYARLIKGEATMAYIADYFSLSAPTARTVLKNYEKKQSLPHYDGRKNNRRR